MSGHFLLGKRTRYRATAMLVVRVEGAAREVYVGAGKRLPADADDVHVEQLLELGLIEAVTE